jgi:rhodanese-related sulfurtransferase
MSMPISDPPMGQITVSQLAERMAQTQPLQLIDVREPEELELAQIQGFVNLPLSQFAVWSAQILAQFDPNLETLVLCHHGVRSAQMCQWLQGQGFTQLRNIAGGIDAYSTQVDPSVPYY